MPIQPLLLIFTLILSAVSSLTAMAADKEFSVVFSKPTDGIHNLYFSETVDGKWLPPFQLTFADRPQILPTLAQNNAGDTWVVWTELGETQTSLHYRVYENNAWNGALPIPTTHSSDTAPSMMIGPDNRPWLTWVAAQDEDTDIYAANWNGLGWTVPQQISEADNTPDLFPTISTGPDGQPMITWSGLVKDTYFEYESHWNGAEWSEEKKTGHASQATKSNSRSHVDQFRKRSGKVTLPESLTDITQASLLIRDADGGATIRLGPNGMTP